jgi:Rod binding domain-containing protein
VLYVDPIASSEALRSTDKANAGARQKAALREMDQLFIFQLLQEMRKSIPKDNLLGGAGMAQDTYNEMLDDAMAANMAKSGQFSVSKQIEDQLKALDAQRKEVPPSGFLPLHPEAKPIPLHTSKMSETGFPLKPTQSAAKVYSLIKAPLKLADN